MPTSEKKSPAPPREPAQEFFYEDSRGRRQDEDLHMSILDQGDHAGAAAVGRRAAKRAGLTQAQIDKLFPKGAT